MTEVHSRLHDGHGFVALDAPTNTIYLAFTGTDPLALQDWFDDLNFSPVPFPGCEGCWVDRGFYHTYLELREQVLAALTAHLQEHRTATFRLTGHSLGAALAVFASLEIIHTLGLPVEMLYTFGQPRIGNSAFQSYLHASLTASACAHFRVTHHRDPVPHLPPSLPPSHSGGFRHEPQEVFYPCGTGRGMGGMGGWSRSSSSKSSSNSSSSSSSSTSGSSSSNGSRSRSGEEEEEACGYVVCDPLEGEDPRGSNQFRLAVNFVDHITYLGFPFTVNYLQCGLFSPKGNEEGGGRKEGEQRSVLLRGRRAAGG